MAERELDREMAAPRGRGQRLEEGDARIMLIEMATAEFATRLCGINGSTHREKRRSRPTIGVLPLR